MMRKSNKRVEECPNQCSGRFVSAGRQHTLTATQQRQLPENAKRKIAESSGSAYRCNYCGCVYIQDQGSNTVLGFLDGMSPGWSE
jgi:hypothetical protein